MKNRILEYILHCIKQFKHVVAGIILLILYQAGFADNLLNFSDQTSLNVRQTSYLDEIRSNPTTDRFELVTINSSEINNEVIQLPLFDGDVFSVTKYVDPLELYNSKIWKGNLESDLGQVHLVLNNGMLNGHITFSDEFYMIKPIGNNLHVLLRINTEKVDFTCSTPDKEIPIAGDVPRQTPLPNPEMNNPGMNLDNQKSGNGGQGTDATGDCRIRVMVLYTTAAGTGLGADPLGAIINMLSVANTGLFNSGISFRYELARVYEETTYVASGSLSTDRNRLRITNDGFMDYAHTERTLWRVDMVNLLVPGGGGISYINNTFAYAFNVTGINNIPVFTYHHENGHNFLCRHDYVNDPTVGAYHGYGHPSGCFRTIMAYQSACGANPCTRVNWFSGPGVFYSCPPSYVTGFAGTHDNVQGHEDSRNTMVNHYNSYASSTYSGDYNIYDGEAVHRAADDEVGYNSATNKFELFSGSEGSFRASNVVTLGQGFHARSGSKFVAYLESCTPLAADTEIDSGKTDVLSDE